MRPAIALALTVLAALGTGCCWSTTGATTSQASDGVEDSPVSQRTDCIRVPSWCGFPDVTNAGLSASTGLEVVDGTLEIDKAGTLVENVEVHGSIDITADNVTLRNVKITVVGETWGIGLRSADNTTVEDCEIAPSGPRLQVGIKDINGDAEGTTIRGCDISRTATGIQVHAGLVEDNYIHDMAEQPGDHVNGVTSNGGQELLVIHHNTILNQQEQTDAIGLFQDFDVQSNRTITDNLLGGGGYTIYGGAGDKGPSSGIVVRDNRFARSYFPRGGQYGPAADFETTGPGNVWSGNVWDDSLEEVRAP